MRTPRTLASVMPFVFLSLTLACGDDTGTPPKDAAQDQPQSIDTGTEVPLDVGIDLANVHLNDGQILMVAEQINSGEIEEGLQGANGATKQSVVDFAKLLQSDHLNANVNLATIAHQNSLVEAGSTVWSDLVAVQTASRASLAGQTGPNFDKVFIQNEIDDHTKAVKLYDVLLADVTNAALKTELQAQKATAQSHLTKAQQILAELTPDGGADGATD